jgi:lipoyl(octanoyl) transferase
VLAIENAIIHFLGQYQIKGHTKCKAPGVYVNDEKICSVGFRVRKGCTYHGISLNVKMDLSPFELINPCGFKQLKMTQTSALNGPVCVQVAAKEVIKILSRALKRNMVKKEVNDEIF